MVQYRQLIGIPRPISSHCFYKDICPSPNLYPKLLQLTILYLYGLLQWHTDLVFQMTIPWWLCKFYLFLLPLREIPKTVTNKGLEKARVYLNRTLDIYVKGYVVVQIHCILLLVWCSSSCTIVVCTQIYRTQLCGQTSIMWFCNKLSVFISCRYKTYWKQWISHNTKKNF